MKKFLVLEDSKVQRAVLVNILESCYDCEVQEVENGEEGLNVAAEEPFDLIISDIMMPMIDGMQFLDTIRSEDGTNKNTPILFISANNDKLDMAKKVVEVFWVEKPVSQQI
jgi:CheY-like chemotaxis protein